MEQISKIHKCFHCGATLQTEDPSLEGYVSHEILDNPNQSFYFCNKCFEAERFHSVSNEPYIEEDFIKIINKAKEKQALLVYCVNAASFETSFSKEVIELINGMKLLVVGTKYDLLPENAIKDDIREYIAHRFRVAGLKITYKNVMLTSSHDDQTSLDVLSKIFELKNNKDVYVIGPTNCGKTALIQSFLKNYSNLSNGTISKHEYPGTHLNVMEIPLNNRSSIYETPGISITNSLLFNLDARTTRAIVPTKALKPRELSLSKEHSIYIGGLAVIEKLDGEKTSFTCYFNDSVSLKRNHVHDVESKFIRANNKKELIPSLPKIKSTKDMEIFEIEMKKGGGEYRDIGITGLGWVCVKTTEQKLRIYVPKGVSIYTSRPKVRQN